MPSGPIFGDAEQQALQRIMAARRDMRHFTPGAALDPAVLAALLQAAHQGPSVGLMQPWRLIHVRDDALRVQIAQLVDRERQATAQALEQAEGRGQPFLALKVEGIREAAALLAVVQAPDDGTLFGRRTLPREMALLSTGCAMQNLWLAARAHNLGLGWVSLIEPEPLAALLHLPEGAQPLGLLCIGPVPAFYAAPMLAQVSWRTPRPLHELCFDNRWGQELPIGG
nr:5,6-dimethylbenzimidazole synthase [Ottowia testudinis]